MSTINPTYRRWEPPVNTRLPDIHGWLEDMHSAREFATRLSLELSTESPDPVLLDVFSTSALIRYSRCFTSGIRTRLSIDELSTASLADRLIHEKIRDIRDRHIAHPINEQEVHATYLILDGSQGATTGAIGLSSFSNVDLHLQPLEIDAMLGLCDKWVLWLKEQLAQENIRLMPFALKLSRDQLLSLPTDEPRPNSDIRAKRRQVQPI